MEELSDELLAIYVCTSCGERSLMIDGSITPKAKQPDGWGCDCMNSEFEIIELDTIGQA